MLSHRKTLLAAIAATALTVPTAVAAQGQQQNQPQGQMQGQQAGMTRISCEAAMNRLSEALQGAENLSPAQRQEIERTLQQAERTDSRVECRQLVRRAHDAFADVEAVLIVFDDNDQPFVRRGSGQVTRADAAGGQIIVRQPEPQVTVDTQDPQVTVDQKRPQVTVRQPRPEIVVQQQKPTVTVDQPAPVVTVQQPQPEVTVNIPRPIVEIEMPKPDVDVDTSRPQVSVQQPKPQIRFVRPEPRVVVQESEAQVSVDQAQPEVRVSEASNLDANVNIESAEPEVRFQSSGEANVDVEQGRPQVRVTGADEAEVTVRQEEAQVRIEEEAEQRAQQRQAQAQRGQQEQQMQRQQTAAEVDEPQSERERIIMVMREHPMYGARSDDLVGDDVYGANGEQVGDVERIAIANDRIYAIVSHGGFLGMGDKEVALPINRLVFAEDRVILPRLTEQDLERMRDVDLSGYEEVPRGSTLRDAYENR